jgi:hypothetical protein
MSINALCILARAYRRESCKGRRAAVPTLMRTCSHGRRPFAFALAPAAGAITMGACARQHPVHQRLACAARKERCRAVRVLRDYS